VGVVTPDSDRYPDESVVCFLCGETAADGEPVAYWMGAGNSYLWLHGGCVGSFVHRLGRDAWQIENEAGDGKYTVTIRQPGLQISPSA
jgi:hypothetical protein